MMTASVLRWQSSDQLGIMLTSSQSILIVMDVVLMVENSSIAQTCVSFGNAVRKRISIIAQLVIYIRVIS